VRTIVDTGPLVAFFTKNDTHHDWAGEQFARLRTPLFTCEAVMAEVCYLLGGAGIGAHHAVGFVTRGALKLDFSLSAEIEAVAKLMARYEDAGISLADACLVHMSELTPRCQVMTIDRDFLIYRRDGRKIIPLLAPFG
jgi:predicted nucleic acid-binding protein